VRRPDPEKLYTLQKAGLEKLMADQNAGKVRLADSQKMILVIMNGLLSESSPVVSESILAEALEVAEVRVPWSVFLDRMPSLVQYGLVDVVRVGRSDIN
jgi:hypothetical protein